MDPIICPKCKVVVAEDEFCPQCHVDFSDPCGACGQAGYHAEGCPESDETIAAHLAAPKA